MAITRQRKILIGVLVVGVCAVVTDRLVLSRPLSGAQEASADLLMDAAVAAAPTPSKATGQAQASAALAQRLEGLATAVNSRTARLRDAFEPPAAWAKPAAHGAPVVHGASGQQYQLQAVMSDAGGGLAVINGRSLRVGQWVDGAQLRAVYRRAAVLAKEGQTFTLELPVEP